MKKYWKAYDELINNDNIEENKQGQDDKEISLINLLEEKSRSSRRNFLKAFGFSIGSAAVLASCKRPVTKAIPYLIKPENITPSKANYYASTFYDGEQYSSILVKVYDGRPIKIEGNDLSGLSKGGTTPVAQASVLELYDENRIKNPQINGQDSTWENVDKELVDKLQTIKLKSGKIVLLTSSIISPSTFMAIDKFKAEYPEFKHVMYDPVSVDGILSANEISFGERIIPDYNFEKANVIVSINADFLGNWLSPVEFSKGYISKRKLDDNQFEMSRHIQMESGLSITGSNADERIPIKPSEEKILLASLYIELLSLSGSSAANSVPKTDVDVKSVANELFSNKNKSLVLCGSNDTETQILVNEINYLLQNYGHTIDLNTPLLTKKGSDKELVELIDEMNRGDVDGLFLYNVNPAYDLPNSDNFIKGISNVGLTVSFSNSMDETSELTDYICPDNHYLESWNDANPKKGYYSLCQPAIGPLFKTRQFQDSLLTWSKANIKYEDVIKAYWSSNLFSKNSRFISFTEFWNHSLHDGIFEIKENINKAQPKINSKGLNKVQKSVKNSSKQSLELHLYENNTMGTGKHANNPWLQETPDSISKVCWDNFAAISPKFASENGLVSGDVIEINTIEIPVLIQPGQKYNTLSVALGYGRTVSGKVAKNVGSNFYPLIRVKNGQRIYHQEISIRKTGKKHDFAMTQTHHSMEGRDIVRETNFDAYMINPSSGNEMHEKVGAHLKSLYEKHEYKGHHWGLVVDLNSCIGCNACVVGCTAENNVPVVGKEEVKRVHEMHWIRIDRYYSGDPENPEVLRQPVMCQHCDNAPCENVCPVKATTHSSEGINQMIYNRCIGTRYCNNNCPYKVRRFNWYDYTKADAIPDNTVDMAGMTLDLPRMVLNPDVTIRAKGVIEKCSFCIQRIQEKKLQAKLEGRPLVDGEIKTACEQACPTHAIVFGDLNDKNSKVAKLMQDQRNYHLLEELHTLPSVGYLTKVRNKNNAKI